MNRSASRQVTPAGVKLAGTGMGLPDRVVTNDDLAHRVETSDDWISQRTGIRQRRMVGEGQNARTLSVEALQGALDAAGLQPTDLDMIILATLNPEMSTPSIACRVQAELGATNAGAVDILAACSGFVYGLNFGYSLVKTGFYKNVAILGTEVLSEILDWNDRRVCVLFGDGCAAAILSASDDASQGCLYQTMNADGNGWKELYCPRQPRDIPADDKVFSGTFNTLQMNGREIYKFAVATLEKSIHEALAETGLELDDLSAIIVHQSNARIIEGARKRLGLKDDKMYVNIERYGNTSAASVPICLHELVKDGRVKSGDHVLFVGLGGGLTWASSLWKL